MSACSSTAPWGGRRNPNQNTNYFVGNEGVRMTITDPSSPPPRMYYYGDAFPDDNGFLISVDVHNVGASWTRGGVYVSGYDPSMIRIDEIDIPRLGGGWQDCVIDFGIVGGAQTGNFWDNFVGQVGCSNQGLRAYSQGGGNFGFMIDSIGKVLGGTGDEWWYNVGFTYDNQFGNPNVGFRIDDNFNLDFLNRGQGLLVLLSGLSFQRYNGQEYILAPDDYNFPGGEFETIVFNGNVYSWPQGLDRTERPVPFLITNCYAYTTYAAPQVCIDPAPYDQGVKVCVPRQITFNGGNGAPVAVTSISQENTRQSIYFTINIQNVGNGQIFDMGYLERCSPYFPGRLSQQHLDRVYLIDARIGTQHLTCTPDRGDGVRLVNGRGQVQCKYQMEYQTAKSAYETPLIIELGYGYAANMQRSMSIKRAS